MQFPELLKEIMESRQISRGSLARTLGISKNHVSDMAKGDRKVTAAMIDLIGQRLQLAPEVVAALHHAGAQDRGFKV